MADPLYPVEWMAETQSRTVRVRVRVRVGLITILDIDGIGHNWEGSIIEVLRETAAS